MNHSSPLRILFGFVAITTLFFLLWLVWKKKYNFKWFPCRERLTDENFIDHLRRTVVPQFSMKEETKDAASIVSAMRRWVVIRSPSHSSTRMILDDLEGRRRSCTHNRDSLPKEAELSQYEPGPIELAVSSQGERTVTTPPPPPMLLQDVIFCRKDFGRK